MARTYAAVVMLKVEGTGPGQLRADLAGKDCDTLDEALGELRDVLAQREDGSWLLASVYPNLKVASAGFPDVGSGHG